MKTSTDPRHQLRVDTMQHLFASSFRTEPDSEVVHIWEKLGDIDPILAEVAPEWPIDKLNPIDLAILRLAIYELRIDSREPYKVIIDEAIELAKEFGSDNSASFINGALGAVVKKYEH